ncbi:MAG: enoyl-CoA hydratase/isomerase family protein [Euryarchaeota archaeon]|jgi:methylglutaconyl-CoA hydratase|nr:enoyl-CoA hydratase/isomerase family protein [Euryarchaeota archaeon]
MAFSECEGAIAMIKFSIEELLPETGLCSLSIEGPIAYLTLQREDVFNALSPELIGELCDLLDWCTERSVGERGELNDGNGAPYLRVIVMRGAGKHFCAGADIGWMQASGAQTAEQNRADAARLDRLFNTLWSHPCFTIGAVQGVALGGGAGLVACLDHVIGEEKTRIALSEGKLGILPAVIGPYVYRRLGSAQTRRLAMLASRIAVDEALRIGMIDQCVDSHDDFSDAIQGIVSEVLSTGPMAVSEAKKLILTFDRWQGSDEELRQWTLDKTSQMRGSEEGQEGLSSFIERRPAAWKNED